MILNKGKMDSAIVFWICIAIVVAFSLGKTAFHKICVLNKKYHMIEFEDDSVYDDDDD